MSKLNFIYPQWPAPSNVRALSTTRVGGVSAPPFDSLNLAQHVNDRDDHVSANRQRLMQHAKLPSQPRWLNQTHSTNVVEIDSVTGSTHDDPIDADATVTGDTNVVCSVLTADCLPILFTNQAGSRVAAIHAGWRGLANGILETAIAAMHCPSEQIIAWAGPCIGSTAFEVGLEVQEQLGGPASAYQNAGKNKVYADLVQLAQCRLYDQGVVNFSASGACTYVNETDFFSYRRNGESGRMATLVWIESL